MPFLMQRTWRGDRLSFRHSGANKVKKEKLFFLRITFRREINTDYISCLLITNPDSFVLLWPPICRQKQEEVSGILLTELTDLALDSQLVVPDKRQQERKHHGTCGKHVQRERWRGVICRRTCGGTRWSATTFAATTCGIISTTARSGWCNIRPRRSPITAGSRRITVIGGRWCGRWRGGCGRCRRHGRRWCGFDTVN